MLKKFDMSKILSFGLVFLIVLSVALSTGNSALANPNFCPPGQQENCVLAQHRVTGECQWFPSHAINPPWITVEGGVCPKIVVIPTSEPESPMPNLAAPIITAPDCPWIKAVGYGENNKVLFTTLYQLLSPAGNVYSFGDLRVTKLVFIPSSPLYNEETDIVITEYTWIPRADFSELLFRETKEEATCKIKFEFGE